ncbi:MAG: RDD family protein [Campylobacterota bacterium]|nr:RDD family protein [Campylobacterota bacterium]
MFSFEYNVAMRWRNIKNNRHTAPDKPAVTILFTGFWGRAMGFITDLFMIGLPISIFMMTVFGRDEMKSATALDVLEKNEAAISNAPDPMVSILHVIFTMSIYVYMWHKNGQTPGKKMARSKVVDATTLKQASYFQLAVRFLGYFLSAITIVGFFIGLLRKDNRTLHDLISRTAVINTK